MRSDLAASRPKEWNDSRVQSRPLLAVAIVSALVGCGDSDDEVVPPPDDPREAVIRYMEAFEDEDFATVCEVIQANYDVNPERCEAGFARLSEKEEVPDFDAEEDIGNVSFRGDGTARVENLETGGYWDVEKHDGEWRLQLSD